MSPRDQGAWDMAARQKISEEESDVDERQQAGLRTRTPAVRNAPTIFAKHRDTFAEKEIKIEPIYPAIIDNPGQLDLRQLSRHERVALASKILAEEEDAQARRKARASEKMPELAGHVVYSKKEKAREVHLPHMAMAEGVSPFLKDGLMSEEELYRQAALAEVNAPVLLPITHTIPQGKSRQARLAAITHLRQWIMQWVRRVAAVLSQMRGPMLTRTGRQALAQLQRLYALVSADLRDDSIEMVQLRVAFGEAYYHMMEASRRHHKRHRGRGQEDYGAYFGQFLSSAPE